MDLCKSTRRNKSPHTLRRTCRMQQRRTPMKMALAVKTPERQTLSARPTDVTGQLRVTTCRSQVLRSVT
ncbi:unnamed protein product [Symbiodinium natans]|uniref:Uncharacterized protein n=1 Tax=Symbiodinium natans TaxID=878477 RepID=A0A812KFS7_9DINO|nr:unnamed protein product [Symbiodinium natans]